MPGPCAWCGERVGPALGPQEWGVLGCLIPILIAVVALIVIGVIVAMMLSSLDLQNNAP